MYIHIPNTQTHRYTYQINTCIQYVYIYIYAHRHNHSHTHMHRVTKTHTQTNRQTQTNKQSHKVKTCKHAVALALDRHSYGVWVGCPETNELGNQGLGGGNHAAHFSTLRQCQLTSPLVCDVVRLLVTVQIRQSTPPTKNGHARSRGSSFGNGSNQTNHSTNQKRPCTESRLVQFYNGSIQTNHSTNQERPCLCECLSGLVRLTELTRLITPPTEKAGSQ